MRPYRALSASAILLFAATTASGQDRPILSDQLHYQGVVPGTPNPPPRARVSTRGDRAVVTWPGFQSTGQGSRIFVQMSRPAHMETLVGPSRIVFRLTDSVISTRNNRNPLDTSQFNTPVSRAFLRTVRRDVELVVELRAAVQPNVTSGPGEGGFHFVFIDFPGGDWLPHGQPAVPDPRRRSLFSGSSSSSSAAEPPPSPSTDAPIGPSP